jgi:hypothetical protein
LEIVDEEIMEELFLSIFQGMLEKKEKGYFGWEILDI